MMERDLHYTFATWTFSLFVAGVEPADAELAGACRDIVGASDPEKGNAAGEALVARVGAVLRGTSPEAVVDAARSLYGERVTPTLGSGDREHRVSQLRRYQFHRGLPWLARIWERSPEGSVRPSWLLVQRVTDQVAAMDANPWNDVDEARTLPLADFLVLWELDGCTSVSLK